jgi:iron complex outermembrane recepter protein
VNGDHRYNRFNPSVGLTYRAASLLQFYASYAETNRAPTPLELSCASPAFPCSLLNFFVGDPDLKQVVARTAEAGLRGNSESQAPLALRWNLDVFHTESDNDIIYEVTTYNPNLAFYTNAGRTLREGLEASLKLDVARWHASLGYAFTKAIFQTPLLLGTSSPAANANGEEQVEPGDRIPGVPRHRANRFGDEANLTAPLGGYTVVDLDASYHAGGHVTLFVNIENLLDKYYYTYGTFGPVGDVPWPNIPGGVTDPRTSVPGKPRSAYGGLRVSF